MQNLEKSAPQLIAIKFLARWMAYAGCCWANTRLKTISNAAPRKSAPPLSARQTRVPPGRIGSLPSATALGPAKEGPT